MPDYSLNAPWFYVCLDYEILLLLDKSFGENCKNEILEGIGHPFERVQMWASKSNISECSLNIVDIMMRRIVDIMTMNNVMYNILLSSNPIIDNM